MDVTAAILAGGPGTRLRSVVADRPKVLAPVEGRPFVTYVLDRLAAASVRTVVLLTGYRAELVRDVLGDTYAGMRLAYSEEPTPLGTGGALRGALPFLAGRRVLLLNGDSFCDVRFEEFYEWQCRTSFAASLVLVPVLDVSRFGQVCLDEAGSVLQFEEKGTAGGRGWINAGVYFIERELIEGMPANCPLSLERDVLPGWIARRLVGGIKHGGRFLDIGTPESYSVAEDFMQWQMSLPTQEPRDYACSNRHGVEEAPRPRRKERRPRGTRCAR